MMRRTVTFQQVKHSAQRVAKCPACGKKMRRSRTFMQTINPFNTGADGLPKTGMQIKQELITQAKAWVNDADKSVELCPSCQPE